MKTKTKKTRKTRQVLGRLQIVQLHRWLSKRKKHAKSSYSHDLATEASKELGFDINKAQMEGMRKEMGLYAPVRGQRAPKGDRSVLKMLAREIKNIQIFSGMAVPKALEDLAK